MASRREETSDSEEESSFSLSDNENLAPPNKKRRGRKAQWRDCHVADMVDVICSNNNFFRKLIFTISKNTRNNEVYVQVLKEVEKRYTGSSSFPFSTRQMRTKFKRCVAECKKLALTIKTATGVKKKFKKIVVMGHGSTSYFPWCSQEILATQSLQRSLPPVAMPRARRVLKPVQRTKAKTFLSPEKDPRKRKRRKTL